MTSNHTRALADAGDRCCKRASLYHVLLKDVIDSVKVLREFYGESCPFCAHHPHTERCLCSRIERALAADAAEIAALLAAAGEREP